jgi:lipopolysaccharide export system protein LptA
MLNWVYRMDTERSKSFSSDGTRVSMIFQPIVRRYVFTDIAIVSSKS